MSQPPTSVEPAGIEPARARPIVVLTNPIHPDALALLQAATQVRLVETPTADSLRAAIADADALIVRAQLPENIFDGAPRLRAVVRHGVGLDMIPVAQATARRIPVANVPGSNTGAVVEYCLAGMLALRRRLADMDRTLREQGWAVARPIADPGVELSGQTCGIVGVGAIGGRLAQVASALGMNVIALTRRPQALPDGVRAVDRATLFREADVVVLCCPLTPETRGLVSRELLATMKPDGLLINVSRGPVVDTDALIDALKAGRLGGAASDVHDIQPLPADHAVFSAPRLLLTPHVAGITATSMRRMSDGAVATTLALLRGERPATVVNPEVFQ